MLKSEIHKAFSKYYYRVCIKDQFWVQYFSMFLKASHIYQ